MEGFNGVFFKGFHLGESLAIIEVDEISSSVVLTSLSAFRAIPGEVSYFSALETGVRLVCCGSCIALEATLRSVPLIAIGVLPSAEVVASIVSSVVSPSRRPVPIYIHGNWSVIHPARGVR